MERTQMLDSKPETKPLPLGDEREIERARLEAEKRRRRLARKAQQFDVSELPLFGDSHKQTDMFGR